MATRQQDSGIPGSTQSSHIENLLVHYADALSDLYGTPGSAPCIYKTGHRWQTADGVSQHPLRRQMWPVFDPILISVWEHIITTTASYFDSLNLPLVTVAGYAVANAGDKVPFCPTLIDIGVPPNTISFTDAKNAAEHVRHNIVAPCFSAFEIDVAVTERSETSFLSYQLDGLVEGDIIREHRHPYTSTPSLGLSPLDLPGIEGTSSVFYRHKSERTNVFAPTASHVACGLSTNYEPGKAIAHLGPKAFEEAKSRILERKSVLEEKMKSYKEAVKDPVNRGGDDPLHAARRTENLTAEQNALGRHVFELYLQLRALESCSTLEDRIIGNLLHADAIALGPDKHTMDWAAIQLNPARINWDTFVGNKIYVGEISSKEYEHLMVPKPSEKTPLVYPKGGLLQVTGVVPKTDVGVDMPVLKNGIASGTTFGRVNGLKTLARRSTGNKKFDALELTILADPSAGNRAFSGKGDSGAVIVDGLGRAVGLVTGGSSALNGRIDFTFATPFYEVECRIKEVFPDYVLY